MPLRYKYTIIADDIRVEITKKLIVVGMYAGHKIGIPSVPYTHPSLTFANAFESDTPAKTAFRFVLSHVDSQEVIVQGPATITAPSAGHGIAFIRVAPITFKSVGRYVLELLVDGFTDAFRVYFDVELIKKKVP